MSIFQLPLELVFRVADGLEPEDILHLSLTSKALAYLIGCEALCKQVLLARAPYSPEAIRAPEDGDYARGLRALAKRRNAIRMAEPFHAALLGVGTAFTYTNGVLCYAASHGRLRLLDIRGSVDHEVVVDARQALLGSSLTVPRFDEYKVRPLHFAHGILTCILTIKHHAPPPGTSNYLLVLEPRAARLILAERLLISRDIHVRNTDRYLFFCHVLSSDAYHRWGARQLDLGTGAWLPRPRLTSFAVRNPAYVSFDIVGDYLYALTNRVPVGGHVFQAVRFFHASRFPIRGPLDADPEVGMDHDTWTRAYSAAMSEDRWALLRAERDEATGEPVAVQIRREFPEQRHHTSRMCIRRDLTFRPAGSGVENAVHDTSTGDAAGHGNASEGTGDSSAGGSGAVGSAGPQPDSSGQSGDPPDGDSRHRALPPGTRIHHGDNSSTVPHYGIQQCFVRSYFSTSSSFVDLVNDTLRRSQQTQSLRLRVMSELPSGATQTAFWPPAIDPAEPPNPRLEDLHRILNPPGYDGSLAWAVDEGSFVYAVDVGERARQKAIVYVGFDPAVRLHGLTAYHGGRRRPAAEEGLGDRGGGSRAGGGGTRFPEPDGSWTWLEEPLYFQPREKNGFDFFG